MADPIRILHVDDEPQFGELTTKFLERINERFTVETATSASEGRRRLGDDCEYDCVVSDYEMPGESGIEFLEAVRERYPALPFILFTGKGSEEVASEAISAGVSDYLQKGASTEQYELLANRIVTHVEQTRTQRELEERESHLQQAQAVANIGSWEADIRADEIYWSEEVYEIFGIDEEETLIDFEQFLGYVHPDDREFIEEQWNAALEGEEYDAEHRIVTGDGEMRWVRERAAVTFDEADRPIEAVGVVQDITERKEREDQLRRTSNRLDALFSESPDMINFHDAEGRIVKPNPRLCELTGYSASELTEMNVWELDAEATAAEVQEIWEQMEPGDSHKLKSTYRCRDGSTLPVEINIARLDQQKADQDHFVVISRDISDREERKRELERQNERVETFVDALAHDIPNHLNTANLNLKLVREDRDFERLEQVEREHERVKTLVDDLQTLVRAGTPIEEREWLSLSRIAGACWSSSRPDGPATLRVVDEGRIRGNRSRLKQLFENLYWNACEHGGERVTIRVGLCEAVDGFYVADDGAGIPSEQRSEVLSPGYTTADGDHRGLGLAIVDEVAQAHDWDVRVRESEAGGARIECTGVEIDAEEN